MPSNMTRLEVIVSALPEATRVDIAEWGDHPSFRVRGKNFVFSDRDAHSLSFKLPKDEAAAVIATDRDAEPTGYGLGRHGWVSVVLDADPGEERWAEVTEWVRTSYTLVAPARSANAVLSEEAG